MPLVHAVVGSLLIATNAAAALWGFVAYRRNRAPGAAYRQLLAAAQTLVIAQATLGLILLSQGDEPGDRCTSSTACSPCSPWHTPMLCAVTMDDETCSSSLSAPRSSRRSGCARS